MAKQKKWSMHSAQTKTGLAPPMTGNGLYDPFMVICGMVYCCLTHMSHDECPKDSQAPTERAGSPLTFARSVGSNAIP